jgi:hypothetical protein
VTVCVTTNYLDPNSIYPVLDPRRTPGPGPYRYGYAFAWDAMVVTVARTPALSSCEMTILFSSTLAEAKEIQAWNIFNNNFSDRIGSSSLGLASSMKITRAWGPGRGCGGGTDTVVLCRYFAWPRGRTALYSFPPQDFWDFWGGCTVTFEWFDDRSGSGLWGSQTSEPTYPLVRFPDRTLMRDDGGFRVVFGGTDFVADESIVVSGIRYLDAFDPIAAVPFTQLPSTAVDGTVVREWNRPEVYVVYGGAKFWIPDPPTLFALGFDWSRVGVIPPGETAKLRTVPIDRTLLKEQHDPKIYVVESGQLRWVTSPAAMDGRCLPWRHVRIVPDNSLAALPHGPDLGP